MLHREEDADYIIFIYLSDILLTLIAFFVAYQVRVILPYGVRPLTYAEIDMPVALYVLVASIWTGTFWWLKVYDSHNILHYPRELEKLISAIGLAAFIFAGVLYLSYRNTPRLMFVYFILLDAIFLVGYRGIIRLVLRFTNSRLISPLRVIIVGTDAVAQSIAERIRQNQSLDLHLAGFIAEDDQYPDEILDVPVLGKVSDTLDVVDNQSADYIVFTFPLRGRQSLKEIVLHLYDRPLRVFVVPDVLDLAFFRVSVQEWHGIPILGLKEPAITGFSRFIKRVFDLIIATGMLLLLWPVMLIAAIAIKLDSPGEIIHKQQRVGENSRLFTLYKFRSMVKDAESLASSMGDKGKIVHKRPDDPRITRVGRILRRTSIDELPQLFNVLKGDMSMVGPRPELPYIVKEYEPWQYKRFAVPPGITGWWQITGRSDKPMHLNTEDDLYYITHYSPLLDLQILIKTIWVVIKGKGAF